MFDNLQMGDVLSESKVFWLPLSRSALTERPKIDIFMNGRLSVNTERMEFGFKSGLDKASPLSIGSYPSANRISSIVFSALSLGRSPSGAQSFLHRRDNDGLENR